MTAFGCQSATQLLRHLTVATSGPIVLHCRFLFAFIAYSLAAWLVPTAATAEETLNTLLTDHCMDCHDSVTTEGELDLSTLNQVGAEQQARIYEQVLARVAAGEMPPEEASWLSEEGRQAMLAHVGQRLDGLAETLRDDPGHVEMTRLTPYEYRNIMRDLSGGVFKNAGRFLPNEGGAGEGFANVGAAQSMTPAQYEKYVDAAKDALQHVRFYPRRGDMPSHSDSPDRLRQPHVADAIWKPFPRPPVDQSADAIKEVVDEIIQWHVAQQQKWGEEHRDELEQELGFVHPAYLEAAWRFHTRDEPEKSSRDFASVAINADQPGGVRIALAPVALEKWLEILTSSGSESVHRAWVQAWRKLPKDPQTPLPQIRQRCVAIVAGDGDVVTETEDFAPPYEISFHEAKEEVLDAAENDGHWPFRIDIGDAEELFLVVTDAGDGSRGEYAVWRQGRFVYRDGTSKPWQDAVTVRGANSGKAYPFGFDGEHVKSLGEDALGAKPPGALKFKVPENAIVFEVDLALDQQRTKIASIQALVLKEKPKSQSYVPGRFVFGGKKRPVTAGAKLKKEHERALRKRNIAEANKTKIGLNAERNVFADWSRTSLEAIGGPWPDQQADEYEAEFPYHYTVRKVVQNATASDRVELDRLKERLASIATAPTDRSPPAPNESVAKATGEGLTVSRREAELAEQTIKRFAEALWRRELGSANIGYLTELYRQGRRGGLSFDSSLKLPLMGILISPNFLYRGGSRESAEEIEGENVVALSSAALASRLSFFLWASVPDQELRELAAADRLRDPSILRRQAARMLKDPRASSLAVDFAGQLWGFADFANFNNPDPERFEAFTGSLRESMQREVETFLADIFQHDRPLTNILVADYSFLNKSLAEHYDVVDQWRRAMDSPDALDANAESYRHVSLPAQRGGLATMGLFLTKTSLPLRTSPVQRGVWLMESLLGRHLPNPPAGVPPLSEDDTNDAGESILAQLERHRADASCASCHNKIDPLGISLENFDAIGRYRTSDRGGAGLSTVATTHDGYDLKGAVGLRNYLKQNTDEFVDHFNRKLLGYALGRSVSIGDRFLLTQMAKRLKNNEFRFSAVLDEIVSSPQFLYRRHPVAPNQ